MGIINIHPAVREGARTVSVLAGVSGSGKTLSAIYMAYGLANYDASKIGFLDSENKRGSLYADALKNLPDRPTDKPFLIADMRAPFSPGRFQKAVLEFQDAGIEVLVIDSASHEYEGLGGCTDIADGLDSGGESSNGGGKHWNRAKREHRGFVDTMLQCDMHVICCLRAREKVKIEGSGRQQRYIPLGILPVCEKNFMFEATISLLMHDAGTRYELTKVPRELIPNFPGNEYISHRTGAGIRAYVSDGGSVDPKVEKWRNRLLTVTEQGERYIATAWAKVPKDIQAALGESFYGELEASAKEFDRQRAIGDEPETVTTINGELTAQKAAPTHLDFN